VQTSIEGLILLAVVGLLVLLRFDARRFGAAEYDDEEAYGGLRTWIRRLSWYGFGFVLILVVYFLYPQPLTVLHLQIGSPRGTVLIYGLLFGLLGGAYAFIYAWWRFRELRLPPARRYPAGLLNVIATTFIDEATFRGILLGLLLLSNWPAEYAIAFQAVLYALSTRLAGKGRPFGMLLLSLLVGLVGGWLVVETGGIGAAFLAHALTRFAVFVATGHAGQINAVYEEQEEEALVGAAAETPKGWEVVPDRETGPRDYRW
jgi:Type II CAAX prenyl endopeptidase Rce1-like